jgi:hypothetical protein
MSALGQKQTFCGALAMSALCQKRTLHLEPNHLTGCASGNFQLPSMISFRGRYSRTV